MDPSATVNSAEATDTTPPGVHDGALLTLSNDWAVKVLVTLLRGRVGSMLGSVETWKRGATGAPSNWNR